MTEPQYRTTIDQSVAGNGRTDKAETRTAEQTVAAVVATADAVATSLREGQDAAAGVVQQWTERLAGIPFTVVSGGGVGSVVSGRVWVDGTFETINVLLAVQRRSVDRLLGLQQRTAGLLVDTGFALATTGLGVIGGAKRKQTDKVAAS